MNWKRATLTLLLLGSTVGCTRWELSLRRESWDVELRSMTQAAMQRYAAMDSRLTNSDFAAGWKAGYENILRGGAGDPPLVPPKQYLNPASRREGEGQRVNAWHDGFITGAAAARDSGLDSYSHLPTGLPQSEAMLGSPFYSAELPPPASPATSQALPTLPAPLPPVFRQPNLSEPLPEPVTVLESPPNHSPNNSTATTESASPSDRIPADKPQSLPKPLTPSAPGPNDSNEAKPFPTQPESVIPSVKPISARSMIQDQMMQDRVTLFSAPTTTPSTSTEAFESLQQSAGQLRASGWIVPVPPARDGRVAESLDDANRPLSPWR